MPPPSPRPRYQTPLLPRPQVTVLDVFWAEHLAFLFYAERPPPLGRKPEGAKYAVMPLDLDPAWHAATEAAAALQAAVAAGTVFGQVHWQQLSHFAWAAFISNSSATTRVHVASSARHLLLPFPFLNVKCRSPPPIFSKLIMPCG